MFKRILSFYKTSQPSAVKVPAEKVDGYYRKLRIQAFVAGTLGYSLYYVCRTSLNVMKQPIIDSGFLNATQLGLIGACLYWVPQQQKPEAMLMRSLMKNLNSQVQ